MIPKNKILLFGLLLFFGLFSVEAGGQTPATNASPQQTEKKAPEGSGKNTTPKVPGIPVSSEKLIIYFIGLDDAQAYAVGLNLLVADRLVGGSEPHVIARHEILNAAKTGKVLRANDQIFARDVPYLCLNTDAKRAVLGYLEFVDEKLELTLRAYDGVTAVNRKSAVVDGDFTKLKDFTDRTVKALAEVIERPIKAGELEIPDTLIAPALKQAGENWPYLYAKKPIKHLIATLQARDNGLDLRTLAKHWLFESLKKSKRPVNSRSDKEKALYHDLAGQSAKALNVYSKVKVTKETIPLKIREARLLLENNHHRGLQALLRVIQRTAPKEARVPMLQGWSYTRSNQKTKALAEWKTAVDLSIADAEVHEAVAREAAEKNKHEEAGKRYLKAADLRESERRSDLASVNLVRAIQYKAPETALDRIRVDLLPQTMKEKMVQLLDSMKKPNTQHRQFARARLAILNRNEEVAEGLLSEATLGASNSFETQYIAGRFYLENQFDIDKGVNFFKRAAKLRPDDLNPLRGLTDIYLKGEFCEKAIEEAHLLARSPKASMRDQLKRAEVLGSCKKLKPAIGALNSILAKNPDYAPATLTMSRLYRQFGDLQNEKKQRDILKRMDIGLSEKLNSELSAASTKEEIIEQKPRPKKKKVIVQVRYPQSKVLVESLPFDLGRTALVDMQDFGSPIGKAIVDTFFRTSKINSQPVYEDFEKLLDASADLVVDEDLSDEIKVYSGRPFHPDSFESVVAMHSLDSIVLFSISRQDASGEKGGLKLDMYAYYSGSSEVLHADGEIDFGQDKLFSVNLLVAVFPILVLILISVQIMMKKKRGVGQLMVQVNYDRTFEDGYFAIRLSRTELSQAFNVDTLMTKEWPEERMLIESQIRKFFSSRSPLICMAEEDKAVLSQVPPGQYFAYIIGIMVNLDTRKPIGSYEVKRPVMIRKDEKAELEINLDTTEAFVEIRVTKEVAVRKTVREKMDGKVVDVEREVVELVEVGGATVEINEDPSNTKISMEGSSVDYYLPPGAYSIYASYQDLAASFMLTVNDTSPKVVELRLQPAARVHRHPIPDSLAAEKGGVHDPIQETREPRKSVKESEVPGQWATTTVGDRGVELADDILEGPTPMIIQGSMDVAGDNTQIPVDIDDLFNTSSAKKAGAGLAGYNESKLSEQERFEFISTARQMRKSQRWDEAAELYLRAGDYDAAAEMSQRGGNQALNYKIYGLSYLKAGQFREAAEMLKYAEEPLLEIEALEGLRLFDEANRKRGMYWEQLGDITQSMEAYQKAGAFDCQGSLHERLQNFQQAGEAFFKARVYEKAAENFILSGDTKRAAEAYEMDAEYEKAAELYQQLGSNVKVFSLLEKSGKFFEAAEGYKKFGLLDEAVHACQQVQPGTLEFLKASLVMGKIFLEKDEVQLARSVYHKVVENANIVHDNIEKYYEFGVLIQEQGQIHEAYSLFERLQTVTYNYADVAIRLQNLKEKIEQEHLDYGTAPPPGTVPPFPAYRTDPSLQAIQSTTPVPDRQTPVSSRYAFEKELGRGAMGVVYMARDTALDRYVAYKTVSNAIKDNPATLKYFLTEAKSLAALNHNNVVIVYDVGQESNNFFITMEYVDGRSLSDFIREKGRLSTRNCVVIATKICSGLEYAHNKNVVHRDIKPSNVMISNQGEVKIMDFGLAKIMTEAVQDKTVVRGTPLYMSPEQVEGVGVDHTSDLYSYGVTLFEMATGTLPFTKGDIAYHHLHTPPPSPLRYNPSLPEALEKIILKCLEKKKENRYQAASQIKQELAPLRAALMKE